MRKEFLETGEITGTHGVRGELRVHPWSDSPQFLTQFKRLYLDENGINRLDVVNARAHGHMVILKAKGVDDIPSAEQLRGKTVYIARKDVRLEKGVNFVQDIIGCKVYDVDTNACYGEVADVTKTGANDVWHISKDGNLVLIPVIDDVVKSVDVDKETILIKPLKGLFDDEN